MIVIFIIFIIFTLLLIPNIYFKTSLIAILLTLAVIVLINTINNGKKSKYVKTNNGNDNIGINILKENYCELSNIYDEKIEVLDKIKETQYNELIDQCISKAESDFINKIFDMSEKEIVTEIEMKTNNIYENDVNLRLLSQEIENSNQKIEQLLQVEEQLNYLYSEKEKLNNLNDIYNMTKQCIEDAYIDIKKSIIPKYKNNLSSILYKISDGKYSRVEVNDEKIIVENEYGEIIPINLLSTGTIDQIYLCLRLSAIEEISNERVPFFFDETFAFFDDERLENIFDFLNNNYGDRQVCIFSCSKREINILEKMGIKYNVIYLQ